MNKTLIVVIMFPVMMGVTVCNKSSLCNTKDDFFDEENEDKFKTCFNLQIKNYGVTLQ